MWNVTFNLTEYIFENQQMYKYIFVGKKEKLALSAQKKEQLGKGSIARAYLKTETFVQLS